MATTSTTNERVPSEVAREVTRVVRRGRKARTTTTAATPRMPSIPVPRSTRVPAVP